MNIKLAVVAVTILVLGACAIPAPTAVVDKSAAEVLLEEMQAIDERARQPCRQHFVKVEDQWHVEFVDGVVWPFAKVVNYWATHPDGYSLSDIRRIEGGVRQQLAPERRSRVPVTEQFLFMLFACDGLTAATRR